MLKRDVIYRMLYDYFYYTIGNDLCFPEQNAKDILGLLVSLGLKLED